MKGDEQVVRVDGVQGDVVGVEELRACKGSGHVEGLAAVVRNPEAGCRSAHAVGDVHVARGRGINAYVNGVVELIDTGVVWFHLAHTPPARAAMVALESSPLVPGR